MHCSVILAFLILVFLNPSVALSKTDLSFTGFGRSFPLAAGLDIEVGESLLVWGQAGPNQFLYGYIRPATYLSLSGPWNAAGASLEIFPISILGFKFGGEYYNNTSDYRDYDCDLFNCEGEFYRTYGEGHLIVGLGPWFMALRARQSRFQSKNGESNFVIPHVAMIANDGQWNINQGRIISGFNLNKKWRLSALYQLAESTSNQFEKQTQSLTSINLGYHEDHWSLTLGGGSFQSTLLENEPTILFILKYSPYRPLGLL